MPRLRRARRPLVALIGLVAALAIGYGVRGCDDGSQPVHHGPTRSISP